MTPLLSSTSNFPAGWLCWRGLLRRTRWREQECRTKNPIHQGFSAAVPKLLGWGSAVGERPRPRAGVTRCWPYRHPLEVGFGDHRGLTLAELSWTLILELGPGKGRGRDLGEVATQYAIFCFLDSLTQRVPVCVCRFVWLVAYEEANIN